MTDVEAARTTPAQDPIWVGVDGSEGSAAAVRFAAHAARDLGLAVHLIYVIPLNMTMSPMFRMVPEDMEPIGRGLLREAEAIAADLLPAGRVTSWIRHGQRARSLVETAGTARFIVLGRARTSTAERLLTGSVAAAVSARSAGSVVVVPAGWTPGDERFHVVVGIKDPDHSAGLASRAMREAADRDGRVTFVHVRDTHSPYEDPTSASIADTTWDGRDQTSVTASLRDVTAPYAGVPVDVRVVHGQPARALQQESGSADLLLLARRDHVIPFGHLGGTTHALLRESMCPVAVVPPAHQSPDPAHLVLAAAETLRR